MSLDCFQLTLNGSLTSGLRNSTLEFNRRQLVVKECVEEHLKNSSICEICQHPYHNLNSYYNEIKLHAEETENGNVCMDIVDLVIIIKLLLIKQWKYLLVSYYYFFSDECNPYNVEPPAFVPASEKISSPAVGFVLTNNVIAIVALRPSYLFAKA